MVKAGILGGGQLGRMLLQQAANYPVETFVLENDPGCPASHLCHHFVEGDIRKFDDVYAFGRQVDVLTIEIESVNIDALEQLAAAGVKVFPTPAALRIIANKRLQKDFYAEHNIPGAPYIAINNRQELEQHTWFFPAVQKLAEGGYDGRGVQVLTSAADFPSGFDAPGILEKMIDIHQEISVIIGVSQNGETAVFDPVEMVFDPALHLLDYQVCPADLSPELRLSAETIALQVATSLHSPGLFAIELFVDTEGNVLVNETAPRVHNSGHHTIETCYSSQYDMLWRILLGYPTGNPKNFTGSALVNLIGERGYSGTARYEGLEKLLAMKNTSIHCYGKQQTRPGRKMGHITVTGNDREALVRQAGDIKKMVRVIT